VVNGTPPPWWRSLFSDACGDGSVADGQVLWRIRDIGNLASQLEFLDLYVIVMWCYVHGNPEAKGQDKQDLIWAYKKERQKRAI